MLGFEFVIRVFLVLSIFEIGGQIGDLGDLPLLVLVRFEFCRSFHASGTSVFIGFIRIMTIAC